MNHKKRGKEMIVTISSFCYRVHIEACPTFRGHLSIGGCNLWDQ